MCFSLDPQQRKGIARRRQQTRDYHLAMRLSTLLWRDDGKTEAEIDRPTRLELEVGLLCKPLKLGKMNDLG